MPHLRSLSAVAVLLLLAPLCAPFAAAATTCLGQGIAAEDFTPKGVTNEDDPRVWGLFRWQVTHSDWSYWFCFSAEMQIDGVEVPKDIYGNAINGAIFIEYAGAPLAPGVHAVHAAVRSNDGLWFAELSWTFTISCGSGLSPSGVHPSGFTSDPVPEIRATFQDVPRTCGADSFYMEVDGTSVPATLRTEGSSYVVSWTPSAPLLPGPHVVRAGITERCCNPSGLQDRGEVAWSFTYAPGVPVSPGTLLPGIDESVGTPTEVPVPETCIPLVVCVGPSVIELPAVAGADVEVEATLLDAFADPLHTTPVGPVTIVVPTPGPGTPVHLCPATCPQPTPGMWVEFHAGVHATAYVLDNEVPVDRDVDLVIP